MITGDLSENELLTEHTLESKTVPNVFPLWSGRTNPPTHILHGQANLTTCVYHQNTTLTLQMPLAKENDERTARGYYECGVCKRVYHLPLV